MKKTHMNFCDPKKDSELNAQVRGEHADAQARNAWIQSSRDLMNEVHNSMQRQRVNKLACVVPCLDEEADMLEWAGISFG